MTEGEKLRRAFNELMAAKSIDSIATLAKRLSSAFSIKPQSIQVGLTNCFKEKRPLSDEVKDMLVDLYGKSHPALVSAITKYNEYYRQKENARKRSTPTNNERLKTQVENLYQIDDTPISLPSYLRLFPADPNLAIPTIAILVFLNGIPQEKDRLEWEELQSYIEIDFLAYRDLFFNELGMIDGHRVSFRTYEEIYGKLVKNAHLIQSLWVLLLSYEIPPNS